MMPSRNAIATICLSIDVTEKGKQTDKPSFSPYETRKITQQLHQDGFHLEDLISTTSDRVDSSFESACKVANREKLEKILNSGHSVTEFLKKMMGLNVFALCKQDPGYPEKFYRKMGDLAPLIIFTVGNLELLKYPAMGVVGARAITPDLIQYAKLVGKSAHEAGHVLVSGNAKGSDREGMNGALESGGSSIAIVSHNIVEASQNQENAKYLAENRLLLIIPFAPEAKFSGAHANGRNKLIFALSDAMVVVQAIPHRGGTRNGVIQQIGPSGMHYCPVFVRGTREPSEGLQKLGAEGALTLNEEPTPEVIRALSSYANQIPTPEPKKIQTDPLEGLNVEELQEKVLKVTQIPKTEQEISQETGISPMDFRKISAHMVRKGVLQRNTNPVQYVKI